MPSLRHIYNTPCSKKCQQFSHICYIPNEYGIGWKRLKERQKTNIVLHCLQFKKFCELQLPWDRNTPIKFSVSRVVCFLRGMFHHYICACSKHAAKAQNPQKAVNRSSRFRRCTVVCNIKPVKLAAVCTFPVSFAEKIQSFHHSVSTSSVTI